MPTLDDDTSSAADQVAAATPTPAALLAPEAGHSEATPSPASNGASSKPKKRKKRKRRAGDLRPVVKLEAGHMPDAVDRIQDVLIGIGDLFQRAGLIVYPGRLATKVAGITRLVPRILERGEHALTEDISRAVCLVRYDERAEDDVERDPSPRLVQMLIARRDRLRLPMLAAIVNAPTLRPDGTLLDTPGYDASTGLFFDPGAETFPPISQTPSREGALRALDVLGELFVHFPFEAAADRSIALSGVLTALVRPSLPAAPLHGFSATAPGSGKSKLVDIIAVLATGCVAPVTTQSKSIEEFEKRLDAALLGGAAIVTIDNCLAPVGGNALCAMLTQQFVEVRKFGTNTNMVAPSTAFVAATGNNLTLGEDMPRRALVCRIDPGVELPEFRVFPFEPVSQAGAERGRYVAAALTILLAYATAGRPRQVDALGSFDCWSNTVRSALMWLDLADPCAAMNEARQRDETMLAVVRIMAEWRATIGIGNGPITAADLIMQAQCPAAAGPGFAHPELRGALLAVAERGGEINANVLGRWLGKHAGRVVDGWRFDDAGVINGVRRWRLHEDVRTRSASVA